MVALEILIVLLLGFIIIFDKPIRIEFKVNVENKTTPPETPLPTQISNLKEAYAEMSEEEEKYFSEGMDMITALNKILQGEELPKKKGKEAK
jgi:uncharacterized protein YaaW (UPF0174 family)